jgi:FG-GAP-like repeat
MRERSIGGPEIHSNKRSWASKNWFTEPGSELSLLSTRLFRHELLGIVLLAVLLLTQIACGGGTSQMSGSGGGGTVHQYATGKGPTSVVTADFNGDSNLDLAVTNGTDNTVSVLLGNGDGTFRQHVDYLAKPLFSALAVADFNGDGKQDLVAGGGLLLGNGDGTFQAIVPFSTGTDFASKTKLVNSDSASAGTSAATTVAVGDLNGDGKPDLVFAGGAVLLGNGDGTFRGGDGPGFSVNTFSVVIGDFNGDSKLDEVVFAEATGSNFIITIPGNGDGTLSYTTGGFSLGGEVGWGLALSDFNGDGKLDIVTGDVTTVDLWLGNGDGTFQGPFHSNTNFETAGVVQAIAVADLNADGKPDLVVINNKSQPGVYGSLNPINAVSILLGNGDGTFQAHIDYPTGTTPASVAVGDFNGDGKLDLAVTNLDDNTVSILLGNGDGTFR